MFGKVATSSLTDHSKESTVKLWRNAKFALQLKVEALEVARLHICQCNLTHRLYDFIGHLICHTPQSPAATAVGHNLWGIGKHGTEVVLRDVSRDRDSTRLQVGHDISGWRRLDFPFQKLNRCVHSRFAFRRHVAPYTNSSMRTDEYAPVSALGDLRALGTLGYLNVLVIGVELEDPPELI